MEQRIGPRPRPSIYPLWAWLQWRGIAHRKPDLCSPGHLPDGTRGVRLACEVSDDQLLLSDFQLWHVPLNYGYLALTEAEDKAFEAELVSHGIVDTPGEPLSDPIYHQRILDSWEPIFDLDTVHSKDWLGGETREEKSIQATFWSLSLSQVREVTVFTSRRSRWTPCDL